MPGQAFLAVRSQRCDRIKIRKKRGAVTGVQVPCWTMSGTIMFPMSLQQISCLFGATADDLSNGSFISVWIAHMRESGHYTLFKYDDRRHPQGTWRQCRWYRFRTSAWFCWTRIFLILQCLFQRMEPERHNQPVGSLYPSSRRRSKKNSLPMTNRWSRLISLVIPIHATGGFTGLQHPMGQWRYWTGFFRITFVWQPWQIVGTLTGGNSSCDSSYLDSPDYFGKFSWSWDKNGADSTVRLKDWLDPDNTGIPETGWPATGYSCPLPKNCNIQLYPNPFTDQVQVKNWRKERTDSKILEVLNLMGTTLWSGILIPVGSSPVSLYFPGLPLPVCILFGSHFPGSRIHYKTWSDQ